MKTTLILFLTVLMIFVTGCSNNPKVEKESAHVDTKSENTQVSTPNFGMTLDEFKTKYNEQCLNNGFTEELMIRAINVGVDNNAKKFSCYITRNTYIYGSISGDTGNITSLRVSTYPIEREVMVADGFSVMTIVSLTIAPNLTNAERKKIMTELGVFDESRSKDGLDSMTEYQDIGYSVNSSKKNGLNFMFVALKKERK